MIDLKARIDTIEKLVFDNTAQTLTYAALECRLTIEHICYERLAHTHSYIAAADLKGWQPFKVVQQVSEEANELVAIEFSLSVSSVPVSDDFDPKTESDFEEFEFIPIGKQSGFSIAKLKKLWQGLANVALHIPISKDDVIETYGEIEKIRTKVVESIAVFREISEGNMLSTSLSADVNFNCLKCGYQIKRKTALLKNHQIVNCFNVNCDESYEVLVEGKSIEFIPRRLTLTCMHCNGSQLFPANLAEKLKYGDILDVRCDGCNGITKVRLNIVQETQPHRP